MTRVASGIATVLLAAIPTASLGGCASWRKSNETLIQVTASQDTAKAARLAQAGIKALTHGKIDTAAEKFTAAVAADRSYGPAHNNLGLLHYEQGNLYQAVLAFETAMNLMPHDPTVYYNLALALEAAGKIHEAMDLYLQAVEMEPTNPNFLGNLVRLRVRLGDNDPSLVAQLQDLVLIETRPEWRRWADQLLAMELNPMLDRGPATPEFDPRNTDRDAATSDRNIDDQIIDLSSGPLSQSSAPVNGRRPVAPPLASPSGEPLPAPQPIPIRDAPSANDLPPSIQLELGDLPVEMDYFR